MHKTIEKVLVMRYDVFAKTGTVPETARGCHGLVVMPSGRGLEGHGFKHWYLSAIFERGLPHQQKKSSATVGL